MADYLKKPNVIYGTRAERTAMTTARVFDEFHETDYAAVWQWTGSAWRVRSPGVLVDPSTGLPLGVNNGGIKVYSVSDPSRDVFNSWFFGSDTASEALTANTLANGLWLDQSLLHPSARSIVIINGNAAPDYAYTIEYSRNALGVAGSDTYTVTSVAAGAKAQIVQVAFPAGYDKFVRLTITPTTGQTGTQLNFKAYLAGRGG